MSKLVYFNSSPDLLKILSKPSFDLDRIPSTIFLGSLGTGRSFLVKTLTRLYACEKAHNSNALFRDFFTQGSECRYDCSCSICSKFDLGCFPDLYEVQGNEGIQELKDFVETFFDKKPVYLPFKVLLISNIDTFSNQSLDTLLKAIEEPPPDVRVFMTASDKAKVRPAILSRSFLFKISPYDKPVLSRLLTSSVSLTPLSKFLDEYPFKTVYELRSFFRYSFKDFLDGFFERKSWSNFSDIDKNCKAFLATLPTDYNQRFVQSFFLEYLFYRLHDFIRTSSNIMLLNMERKLYDIYNQSLVKPANTNNVSQFISFENQLKSLLYSIASLLRIGGQ